jgi:hypothetical protein
VNNIQVMTEAENMAQCWAQFLQKFDHKLTEKVWEELIQKNTF